MSCNVSQTSPDWTKVEVDPDPKQSDTATTLQTALNTDFSEVAAMADDKIPDLPIRGDSSSAEGVMEAPRVDTQRPGKHLQENMRQPSGNVPYDHKYGGDGYFGFNNIGTPEGTEPGKLSERERLEILNTETAHDPESSVDESNDGQGRLIC